MNALDANDRTSAFVMGNLGDDDLSLYEGLFVCVGMWPNDCMILEGSNTTLSRQDGGGRR